MEGAAPGEHESMAVPYELLQLLTLSLDRKTKSVWRLVSRATNDSVYESTSALEAVDGPCTCIKGLPLALLGKCTGLKKLVCSISDLESIHGLPCGLEVLEMNNAPVSDLSPLQQCTGLRQLSAVNVLALDRDAGWSQLSSALECMPQLSRLEVNGCLNAIRTLAPVLQTLTGMLFLNLAFGDLSEEGAQALAPALTRMTRLQRLDLQQTSLDAAAARALAPALASLAALQVLDLNRNAVGAEGAAALAPGLAALTALQRLNLSHNGLGPGGARALAPAVGALVGLRALQLGANDMEPEGVQALAPALKSLTRLQQLDLMLNSIGPEGAQTLTPAIEALTALQTLDLGFNNMGAQAVQTLAPILLKATALTSLDLRGNCLGEEGAEALSLLMTRTGLVLLWEDEDEDEDGDDDADEDEDEYEPAEWCVDGSGNWVAYNDDFDDDGDFSDEDV